MTELMAIPCGLERSKNRCRCNPWCDGAVKAGWFVDPERHAEVVEGGRGVFLYGDAGGADHVLFLPPGCHNRSWWVATQKEG